MTHFVVVPSQMRYFLQSGISVISNTNTTVNISTCRDRTTDNTNEEYTNDHSCLVELLLKSVVVCTQPCTLGRVPAYRGAYENGCGSLQVCD